MMKSLSTLLSWIAPTGIWIYQNGIEIGDDHATEFENVENGTATVENEIATDEIETAIDVIDLYLDETAILIDGIGTGYDHVNGNVIGQNHNCHPRQCEAPFCDPK